MDRTLGTRWVTVIVDIGESVVLLSVNAISISRIQIYLGAKFCYCDANAMLVGLEFV